MGNSGVQSASSEPQVRIWLKHIAHYLPSQPPLKDFIHHNTLHAFQHRPFEIGVEEAASFYGARAWESFAFYLGRYRMGDITEAALDAALAEVFSTAGERASWKQRMLQNGFEEPALPAGVGRGGLREGWRDRGIDLDALTHPLFFRLVSNYLDQGVASWEMPGAESGSFFATVRNLVETSFLPLVPLSDRGLRLLWDKSELDVIEHCLSRIVAKPEQRPRYLLEMLFRHRGWSGMIAQVETAPAALLSRRAITLEQAVAVELLLELAWLQRKLGEDFAPLSSDAVWDWKPAQLAAVSPAQRAKRLWHQAFERSYHAEVLASWSAHLRCLPSKLEAPAPVMQAVFCIDDREGGLRRHLEETWSEVETFGVAGFFGIDVMYQGMDDSYPAQHCPAPVRPKHLIRSKPSAAAAKRKKPRFRHFHLEQGANTLFRGWLITQVLGIGSALRLASHVFFPAPSHATASSLSKVELDSELHLLRESNEVTSDGLLLGFTREEMADRVAGLLKQIGLTRTFSDLVVLVAHGASSTNNPHFAAYDCGACSGKPGAPNARAFASMANDPAVRKLVAERGVAIPDRTHFLGGMHDTTRDEVVFFDEQQVPASQRATLEEFKSKLMTALARNARERCRRFLLLPMNMAPSDAHREVKRRASAIFEPRPELNHATNALLIIGRRQWTRGLFLDRREFMNSYDPLQDAEGRILTAILSAAVPVCGGINLEYFFSRIDAETYGAGTKLPHNVFGLIGVANGVSGDLRTGLPTQMTEAHDPVRLLVTVEHARAVALESARRNPAVWEWIQNQWVLYSCLDPESRKLYRLDIASLGWTEVADVAVPPQFESSLDYVPTSRENLAPARIGAAEVL